MTNATIPMEQRDIDALTKLAAGMGVSFEQMAHDALVKLLDEPEWEPFETEEEALDFCDAVFQEVMADETW